MCRHAYFEIPLISEILERQFTEMFYYYFIETHFVVHLEFCEDKKSMSVHYPLCSYLEENIRNF